jgi:hypothetical protein
MPSKVSTEVDEDHIQSTVRVLSSAAHVQRLLDHMSSTRILLGFLGAPLAVPIGLSLLLASFDVLIISAFLAYTITAYSVPPLFSSCGGSIGYRRGAVLLLDSLSARSPRFYSCLLVRNPPASSGHFSLPG